MEINTIAILFCNMDMEYLSPKYPNDGIKYKNLFKPFFPNAQFTIFRLLDNDFPKSIDDYDLFLITGSVYSAYDDFPWIKKLEKTIKNIVEKNKLLVGFCFGHQIIAQALGGKVEKSKKGWGLGIRTIPIKQKSWMKNFPQECKINLIHIHQDQVFELPPNSEKLSGDEFCPNESFTYQNNVLTIQGHPEFSNQYTQDLLPHIKDRFSEKEFTEALSSLHQENDGMLFISWVYQWIMHHPEA